jgi:hypothetical protein
MGMSKTLKDPELPPGAIVETYEDGGALRNDGVRLTPASQNPWYVLATVAGEQEGTKTFEIDRDLHAKNRRFWNGWMCQGMEDGERAALAEKLELPEEELSPLTAEELEAVKVRFEAVFPDKSLEEMIPPPYDVADFGQIYFPSTCVLEKYHFNEFADFGEAHFACDAVFPQAHFTGFVFFRGAHFTGLAYFQSAHFDDVSYFREARFIAGAYFQKAHFTVSAYFQKAHFTEDTDFQEAHFNGPAFFQEADLTGPSNFRKAQFHKVADFSDGCFKSQTMFDGAAFKGGVPMFYHREMHQNTSFTDDPKLWPDVTAENAKEGKRAYTRLRQVAAEIYDPDLEHFFLRQEMRCKARIEWDKRAWFHWVFFVLYRWIADSGISVARPFWLLIFAWALGVACFAGYFDSGILPTLPDDIQDSRYRAAAGISFGNLFGFLGINRLYFIDVLQDHIPDGLQFVAGAQTVAGVILLFFLGLGLRNRFRLK